MIKGGGKVFITLDILTQAAQLVYSVVVGLFSLFILEFS